VTFTVKSAAWPTTAAAGPEIEIERSAMKWVVRYAVLLETIGSSVFEETWAVFSIRDSSPPSLRLNVAVWPAPKECLKQLKDGPKCTLKLQVQGPK
jgi:hypothetical protein